jgi:hypothetical protein
MTIDTMCSAVRRCLPGHLALALLAFSAIPAGAQGPSRHEGRPVAEVLGDLQRRGAPIIFSSVLVRSDLRVKTEPRSEAGTRAFVEEILAPHGLGVADGPGKTWVVTRIRRDPNLAAPAPESAPPGKSRELDAPVPIRIEERVTVHERPGDLAGSPNAYAIDPVRATDTAGSLENPLQALPGMVPGVAATNDHDGKLAVRGAGPQHNTIVYDGVQIHTPQRMASDLGGWQSFVNPATIGSWALDPSGLDARYGGRLSSTTVFETRDGATDRRLALSGSFGLTSGDILGEGRLPGTETGSWWATMRGTYYRLVADRFKDGDIPSFVDLQFKIAASPTPRTRLSVVGLAGAEAMVRPVLAPPDQRAPYGDNSLREFHANSRLAIVNLQWTPGPRVSSSTTVDVYSNVTRHQDGWIDWQTGRPFDRRVQVVDVAGRQRFTIGWSPRHLLDVGGEVKRIRGEWKMAGVDLLPRRAPGPDTWGQFLTYDGPIDARSLRTQVSGWAQERIRLGAGVAMEPGIRADWNSFTGETAVQPRFRLTKSVGERGVVWIGAAWQAQTPGFETMQQGLAYVDLGGAASDVRNERSRQFVAGFTHPLAASVTLRAEVYRRVFDRLLVQRQETGHERQQRLARYELPPDMPADSAILEYRPTTDPESTGRGRAAGIELLLERSRGRITGWITYTLSKSERELFGRTVPFEFDRRHAVGAAVNVEVTRKLRAAVRSQYGSGFPVTPLHPEVRFDDFRNTWPGPSPGSTFRAGRNRDGSLIVRSDLLDPPRLSLLNSARMSPYARTDVRVSYAIDEHLDIYGEVINFFDRENFGVAVPDVADRAGRSIAYQLAPAFPRLFTYGVRFAF